MVTKTGTSENELIAMVVKFIINSCSGRMLNDQAIHWEINASGEVARLEDKDGWHQYEATGNRTITVDIHTERKQNG